MSEIVLKNVTKRFSGNSVAVKDLNITIGDGDFVTLLGPSGCGKTTTLRMIAGLETPTEGEIFIDGKPVFSSQKGIDISPAKRDIGFLFQNYALWPHMTVYKNISFGLENLKWDKAAIDKRINELLELLRIEDMALRYPAELSGGQQQRVAIARTLATNPQVLLMDEPLSNLDAKLRMEMRTELKRLHAETGTTFVYVTHDQLEAMTLSTRVCLMKFGVLQQYSPPLEIYGRPNNTFVADFVGSPTINLVNFTVKNIDGGVTLENDSLKLRFIPNGEFTAPKPNASVVLGMRPENVVISSNGPVEGKVYSSLPSGMETIVRLQTGNLTLHSVVFGSRDFKMGEKVKVTLEGDAFVLFDAESTDRLGLGTLEVL